MQLNLMASLSQTGYGVAGKNIALRLLDVGVDVAIFPYGNVKVDSEEEVEAIKKMFKNAEGFNPHAPCLNIWHQFDLARRIGHAEYLAFPFFELDKFKDTEKHHLSVPHKVLVASEWARRIVEEEVGRDEVYVVPLGVDTSIFYPPEEQSDNKEYTFFNIGKWEKRKGHDILVKAFDKAFTKSDNAHLLMCPHNPFLNEKQLEQWIGMYQNAKLAHKIHIAQPHQSHRGVADMIRQCDCGVFPSRAEGWNLELLEGMACGKPVITTNYGAHTEYVDEDNSYLIGVEDVEDAYDGMWFFGEGRWAELDLDQEEQLIEHMRYCYNERPNNPAGLETAGRFTWTNTVEQLIQIF